MGYHTATTVVLVTLNYIVCYGLWIVYFLGKAVDRGADSSEDPTEPESVLFTTNSRKIIYIDATIKLMACLNSALNGIVHIARGSQIRSQIRRLFAMMASLGSESTAQAGATTTLNTHVNSLTNN